MKKQNFKYLMILNVIIFIAFGLLLMKEPILAEGGSGSADDPFIIETAEELRELSGTTLTSHYKLGADIDLSDANWTPITSISSSGSLDGGEHTITGLKVNSGGGFVTSNSGTIKNLKFSGSNITSNASNVGTVAGTNNATGIIENVHVDGTCYATSASGPTARGGVVGHNYGTIDYCSFAGSIKNGVSLNVQLGGVCGRLEKGVIRNSFNTGTVYSPANQVGGIAGYSYHQNSSGTPVIENCYNLGEISGNNAVGGITGQNAEVVRNCYNGGKTTSSGNVGTLTGSNINGNFSHSYGITGKPENSTSSLFGYGGGTTSECSIVQNTPENLQTLTDNLNSWSRFDSSVHKTWNFGDGRPYPTFDPITLKITFLSGDNGNFGKDDQENPITQIEVEGIAEDATWDTSWEPTTLVPDTGYRFVGWSPEFPETVTSTGDLVFTAQWSNKYKITFVDEDGTTVLKEATEYDYGTLADNIEKPDDPTKEPTEQHTYTFAGWDPVVSDVTQDQVYKATYTESARKYKITFVDEDGTTVLKEATEYDYGTLADNIEKPDDPTKTPTAQYTYTFAGWDPEIVEVTGDATYTAKYDATLNKYTVTWKNEDGTVLETDTDVEYGTMPEYNGEEPTKPSTPEHTYEFKGWTPEVGEVKGNITYTATFDEEIQVYTVRWLNDDGTELKVDGSVAYGTMPSFDKDNPTKTPTAQYTYTFAGWDPEIVEVTGDATYTAKYDATLNKYTVTWKNEDGTVLETDTDVEYGTTPTYDGQKPVKEATDHSTFEFTGWNPEVGEVKGDIAYTAVFKEIPNKYTVTYTDGAEGKVFEDVVFENVEYNAATPALEKEPTRDGYVFKGWKPEVAEKVAGDATYTAQWEEQQPNTYIIRYKLNGGSYKGSSADIVISYKEDTLVSVHEAPTREGYTFSHWEGSKYYPGDKYRVTENHTFTAIWNKNPEPTPTPTPAPTPKYVTPKTGVGD